jgi:hypothetical protein
MTRRRGQLLWYSGTIIGRGLSLERKDDTSVLSNQHCLVVRSALQGGAQPMARRRSVAALHGGRRQAAIMCASLWGQERAHLNHFPKQTARVAPMRTTDGAECGSLTGCWGLGAAKCKFRS